MIISNIYIIFICIIILIVVLFSDKNNKGRSIEGFEDYNIDNINNIWMYWENINGRNKPSFLNLCYKTVEYHCKDRFNIKLLDEKTIHNYLKNIPLDLDKYLSIQQKVDYYRYKLLYDYGGIWVDADTIILKDLYPLIEKLKQYDFVGFGCHFKNTERCKKSGYPYPANWVMSSRKGGKLMKICVDGCEENINKKEILKKKYHILGRELVWKGIKTLLKVDKDWRYYHYSSRCVERDSKNRKFYNYRTISKEDIDEECRDKFLFIPIYNTAPGFPLWFKSLSEEDILDGDYLISKLFRKSLDYEENDRKKNIKFDKYYVINLKETKEGRRRLNKLKRHVYLKDKIDIFPGVYGKKLRNMKLIKKIVNLRWDYGKWVDKESKIIDMSDGELGVCLSHYSIWKKFLKSEDKKIMILEDDAIKISNDFDYRIKDIMRNVPNDWDIILLGFHLNKGDDGKKINEYISKVKNFVLMHCYILNKKGAKKLLENLPISAPLDTWISSITYDLNVYRHNFVIKEWSDTPSSRIILQLNEEKQIKNTNNYNKNKRKKNLIDKIVTIL